MAMKVEEAMDDIESAFALRVVRVRGSMADSGVGADEDFAVLEGDDVGGGGIVHEPRMGRPDGGVSDEGDFHFLKVFEQCRMRPLMLQHQRQRLRSGVEESLHFERQHGLVIVEFQRGHEGKACVRPERLQA